ncbi:MAG: universal stress protein [Solirubrobacteraceae bacterium]
MFDTILWANDGSRRADEALSPVRELCERYRSALRIVHVASSGQSAQERAATERVIDKLKAQTTAMRRQGLNASLHVIRGATGSPAPHLLRTAHDITPDLMIVSHREGAPRAGGLSDSVAHQLLASGACPVLVVRGSARASARARAGGGAAAGPSFVPA